MTLVSSLSHNPSWSLAAKINDGTMSLDVDISDKVHITTAIIWYSKELLRHKEKVEFWGEVTNNLSALSLLLCKCGRTSEKSNVP